MKCNAQEGAEEHGVEVMSLPHTFPEELGSACIRFELGNGVNSNSTVGPSS